MSPDRYASLFRFGKEYPEWKMNSFQNRTDDAIPAWGDTRLLRAFVLTARTGSISAAARELGVAPSTVSKALQALEAATGHTLFWRTTRRLSLSAAGERVLPYCEQALAQLAAAGQALNEERSALTGRIRVAASAGLAQYLMRSPLAAWLSGQPDLHLHWLIGAHFVQPGEGGVDVVLRVADTPPEDWVASQLWRAHLVTVAAPEYLARYSRPQSPADLERHRCLGVCSGDSAPLRWRFAGHDPMPVRPVLAADDEHTVLAGCEAGLGVAQAVDFNAGPAIASGRLQEVLRDYRAEGPAVFALRLPGKPAGKLRMFIEMVRECMPMQPT